MIGLVAAYFIGKDQGKRERFVYDDDALLALVLAPFFVALFMPVLVWIAVRDNGRGRLDALCWTAGALAAAGLVGVLVGWWWVPVVCLAEGSLAVVHVAIRAGNDRRRDEAYN